MAELSPWIIEVNLETFEQDIVEASNQRPVVIDFWAPWCGPCRQLAPILEQLAVEYDGKFLLAKINIDENQELAGAFGVQSIPFVVALKDAQPVQQFMGMRDEAEIRSWLDTFLPSPLDELIAAARELEASDPHAAAGKLREALALAENDAAIQIDLARVLVTLDQTGEAREIITHLEARGFLDSLEAERIKSQLDLQDAAAETGGLDEARRAAEAAPDDLSLQLQLADALAVARKHEEALQICLRIIELDKQGVGVQAKSTMLKIMDLIPGSELASSYRRRLATLLY